MHLDSAQDAPDFERLRDRSLTTAVIGASVGALWDLSVKTKIVLFDRQKGTAVYP
jgi:hypothetical protein